MNWSWTQFLEADCLEDIVEELHKDNVLPLYIHDAFYVPNELATKYTIKSVEILKVIVDDFKSVYQTEENISKVHNEFLKYINAINQTTSTFESKRELSKYVTIFYKENKDKIMKYMKSKDRIFVFADYDVYKIKELIKKAIAQEANNITRIKNINQYNDFDIRMEKIHNTSLSRLERCLQKFSEDEKHDYKNKLDDIMSSIGFSRLFTFS